MQFAFEAFLVEIGLYGNVFQMAFADFGLLATSSTWFQLFWELGDYLDIKVSLHASYHIQPVRESDRALMEEFAHAGFAHKDLVSLNTVRKYKQLLHLSDIVCCDGKTIDRDILTREPGFESCHGFPVEWPIAADYKLWDHAIRAISSSTYFFA